MIAINTEHHEYRSRRALWDQYRDFYTGGEQFKAKAGTYLMRRNREPMDIYQERLSQAFYENYVGSIIDWYAATMFRREPSIHFEGDNETGQKFFSAFVEDCDRKGSNLSDFFRRQITEALICGTSYTLVDFPQQHGTAQSRAEEDASGAARAYLVSFSPDELINWSTNEHGEFEWVVLRTTQLRRERLEDPEPMIETHWHYYDRERFQTYRQLSKRPTFSLAMFGPVQPSAEAMELVAEGLHGLARQRRVPLFEMKLSDGMWLMNKAAQVQMEHFNKSNALGWALTMGLFAMPVVYSTRDWDKVVGESYYLQLDPGDRFGWAEPEGKVYQIAADNLNRLKEEIYRVCYLLSQAGSVSGHGTPVSGLSKQRDFAITQDVLRNYGDTVKDVMRRVLLAIEAAREDGLQISVTGLDEFDIGDFTTDIDDAKKLLELSVGSPTLQRQVYKKLAFKYLCDERQELKDTIAREIDEWMSRGGR